MKKWFKRISVFLLIGFIVIQFFRIDKSVPEYSKSNDFVAIENPDKNISSILTNACYDCHSYETNYPWYAEVAPFSWWIGEHVEEGRKHFNFSLWGDYDAGKKDHKLEECISEIEKNKMPDANYVRMHSAAKISDEDKNNLLAYFQKLRSEL